MRLVILTTTISLLGCSSSTRPKGDFQRAPNVSESQRELEEDGRARRETARLQGRVVLNSSPVTFFGVIVTASHTRSDQPDPTPFETPNGTFQIPDISPGVWDVIVVGPGFATRTLIGVSVDQAVDLGDITVKPGFTVKGLVTDAAGVPVVGASVRIARPIDHFRHSDVLTELSKGNYTTQTDRRGRFVITGYTTVGLSGGRSSVIARHQQTMSLADSIGSDNYDLTITLLPMGVLEGSFVGGAIRGLVVIVPVQSPKKLITASMTAGKYRIELPEGEYDVKFGRFDKRVSIVGQTTATVDITSP